MDEKTLKKRWTHQELKKNKKRLLNRERQKKYWVCSKREVPGKGSTGGEKLQRPERLRGKGGGD